MPTFLIPILTAVIPGLMQFIENELAPSPDPQASLQAMMSMQRAIADAKLAADLAKDPLP